MNLKIIFFLQVLLSCINGNPYFYDMKYEQSKHKNKNKIDYSVRKNQDDTLYVHLIAHTHDDLGWLKNVD